MITLQDCIAMCDLDEAEAPSGLVAIIVCELRHSLASNWSRFNWELA